MRAPELASAAHPADEPPHDRADDRSAHPEAEQYAPRRVPLRQAAYTEAGVGEPESDQGEAESEEDRPETMHGSGG